MKRKNALVVLFVFALFCVPKANAAIEIDGYGIYSSPSGPIINQFSALASLYGVGATAGGFGGGGSFLFGKDRRFLGGIDISGLPLISFSSRTASDTVNALPVLGLLRWRPSFFLVDLGFGFSSFNVTGAVNQTSNGSDTTLMGALGVSFGETFGLDLGLRFYSFFDSSGTITALAPFLGAHIIF